MWLKSNQHSQGPGDKDGLCDLHVVSPGNGPILIGRANAETQLHASAAWRKFCWRRCSDAKRWTAREASRSRKNFSTSVAPTNIAAKSTRPRIKRQKFGFGADRAIITQPIAPVYQPQYVKIEPLTLTKH